MPARPTSLAYPLLLAGGVLIILLLSCRKESVNQLPEVNIIEPADEQQFSLGSEITISAEAEDYDGGIAEVRFYVDGNYTESSLSKPHTVHWKADSAIQGFIEIRAKAIDGEEGESFSEITILVDGFGPDGEPCPGQPNIEYAGKTYATVLIGSQCWLKENLDVGTQIQAGTDMADNGQVEKYCYGDISANCLLYGALYQWDELMQYVFVAAGRGICPPGWHIPTDEQWKDLEARVDSRFGIDDPEWDKEGQRGYRAGEKLKSLSLWEFSGGGTDNYGFTALPCGYRHFTGESMGIAWNARYWSSTIYGSNYAWIRCLAYDQRTINRAFSDQQNGYAVRCVRD